MAYQAMVLYGVVCKDRCHSIYRYCYDKIIRKQTIVKHNVKPRTTKVTILSWFGAKSRLKIFAVSIDTAIRRWANVCLFILANDNLQTCSHTDWQLYFYNILFDQIRQYKKALIEIVSINTTVLKAFAFYLLPTYLQYWQTNLQMIRIVYRLYYYALLVMLWQNGFIRHDHG